MMLTDFKCSNFADVSILLTSTSAGLPVDIAWTQELCRADSDGNEVPNAVGLRDDNFEFGTE